MSTEYSSCVYRSKDPIRNFKIKFVEIYWLIDNNFPKKNLKSKLNRVTLLKSTGRTNYNKTNSKEEKGLDTLYKNLNDVAKSETEEVIINWQTKIFSKVYIYSKYLFKLDSKMKFSNLVWICKVQWFFFWNK